MLAQAILPQIKAKVIAATMEHTSIAEGGRSKDQRIAQECRRERAPDVEMEHTASVRAGEVRVHITVE